MELFIQAKKTWLCFKMNLQNKFEEDCAKLQELIKRGKSLSNKAPSVRVCNLNKVPMSEQNCFKWYTETRNLLSSLFGDNFRDVVTFKECFSTYHSTNLSGQYSGDMNFIKEDMHKAVGVLEGTYNSFKDGKIKRQNQLMLAISKGYRELKDWGRIVSGITKRVLKR